jgi:hypothetical protein
MGRIIDKLLSKLAKSKFFIETHQGTIHQIVSYSFYFTPTHRYAMSQSVFEDIKEALHTNPLILEKIHLFTTEGDMITLTHVEYIWNEQKVNY